jgi:hypothetical protein
MDLDVGAVANCTLICPDSARVKNNTASFLPRIRGEEAAGSSCGRRVRIIASSAANTVLMATARLKILMIRAWEI